MAPEAQPMNDMQYLLSDLNTRIRDAEERNRITKERTLLIGKNLVDSKVQIFEEIKEIKRNVAQTQRDIKQIKKTTENLIQETGKYIKRDEIMLIERMLKDFQPLEFVRMNDIDRILDEKKNK